MMRLADEIKKELMRSVGSNAYDIIIPNYFVGRYEMDVFFLSKSGRLTEYEIKTSRADYFKDFEKGTKHELMKQCKCAANRFYFVCPDGLIKETEVPVYAGLLYYSKGRNQMIKSAPLLHKNKYNGSELVSKLAFRCESLAGKLRMAEYKRKEGEKRIASLKETVQKLDPKNIQLLF